MRSWFALALFVVGILSTALPFVPSVAAECHCTGVGCAEMLAKYDDNEDGAITGEEFDRMNDEEGVCTALAKILAELLNGGLQMSAYIGGDGLLVTGDGMASLPLGQSGSLHLHFEALRNGTNVGSVHFGAVAGLSYTSPTTVGFDTEGDAVAHIEFDVSDEAPDVVAIPYTVTRLGMPDEDGVVTFTTVEPTTTTIGGLTPIELGIVAGTIGLLLGAIVTAVIMLATRRS